MTIVVSSLGNLIKANKRGFAKNSIIGEFFNKTKAKSLNVLYKVCKIKRKKLELKNRNDFEKDEKVIELRELLNNLLNCFI